MRSRSLLILLIRVVLIALLLPNAARATTTTPSADVAARVAQLRALLSSDQGAAILDLLDDPGVRQALLQGSDASTANRPAAATAGEMMDETLTNVRTRLGALVMELGRIPNELVRAFARLRSQLPGVELARLIGCLASCLRLLGSRSPGVKVLAATCDRDSLSFACAPPTETIGRQRRGT